MSKSSSQHPAAWIFAALGSDERLAVITAIAAGVNDVRSIVTKTGLTHSTVYRNIALALRAGLVLRVDEVVRRQDREVYHFHLTPLAVNLLTLVEQHRLTAGRSSIARNNRKQPRKDES